MDEDGTGLPGRDLSVEELYRRIDAAQAEQRRLRAQLGLTNKVQQARATLKLSSHAGCRLMTREVLAKAPAVDHGLLHVAVLTAGVGITLNENADPTVTTSAPERGTFDVDDAVPSSDADDGLCCSDSFGHASLVPSRHGRISHASLRPAQCKHFEHTYEGPDDMPGHVKSTLIGTDVLRLSSKAWHLHLIEPRDSGGWGGGHQRRISCTRLPSSHRVSIKVDLDEHGLATQIEAQLLDQADTPGVGLCIASAAEHDVLHHFAEHLNIQSQAVAGAILGHSLAIPMCEGTLCLGGDNQQLVVSAPPGTPGPIRIDALMML
ncbi:uncharacterized protein MONBRDRAFT_9772 [Monosiga brevicollis MX1]|uniref:Uncharacterized protein n=1 Tax=Monosiga brevicollis TaxID=81824 RepID=A9V466_MONBE|nr:uncharacterized protein MONBRDRAFT_9772 [Monosiga brevicollis MX1]EDQ87652.1 predicted protein [Monosiga brevicollis MX1]|eukprot:XP_001747572.1 hypothetical protein [Monosiga brevicollis MX1]